MYVCCVFLWYLYLSVILHNYASHLYTFIRFFICRTILEPFIQKSSPEKDEDSSNSSTVDNKDKLVILRTTKKKVSSAQFSTLVGGEKPLKEFVKATNLQELYAGIELIACEVSFARSSSEERGRELMKQLNEALGHATGNCVERGKMWHNSIYVFVCINGYLDVNDVSVCMDVIVGLLCVCVSVCRAWPRRRWQCSKRKIFAVGWSVSRR